MFIFMPTLICGKFSALCNCHSFVFFRCQRAKRTKKRAPPPATDEEQQIFLASLASLPTKIVGLRAWPLYCEQFANLGPDHVDLPKPLTSHYEEGAAALSKEDLSARCAAVMAGMKVTEQQQQKVQEVTLGQSLKPAWFDQRAGRITASIAGM